MSVTPDRPILSSDWPGMRPAIPGRPWPRAALRAVSVATTVALAGRFAAAACLSMAGDCLAGLRERAICRIRSVLGSYLAYDAESVASQAGRLDEYGCRWVLAADAEELRSQFFPRNECDRPGVWQSVDVMCPAHGGDHG